MSLFTWLPFALVCLLGAMSPGPSLALVINKNVSIGRFAGILTSLGHGIGIGVYSTITVLGLGIIIQTNQIIFLSIQILGLIFLLILGVLFFFQKETKDLNQGTKENYNSIYQGFLIAIFNPKILIWFTAIFSQFINDGNFFFNTILVLTASIIDALWYILVSFLITSDGIKKILLGQKKIIQKITGSILIMISLSLLYSIFNY